MPLCRRPHVAAQKSRAIYRPWGLLGRHLGDFDLDPELDLGQDAVESGVAGAVLEMGRGRLELLQRAGVRSPPSSPILSSSSASSAPVPA